MNVHRLHRWDELESGLMDSARSHLMRVPLFLYYLQKVRSTSLMSLCFREYDVSVIDSGTEIILSVERASEQGR